MKQIIDLDLREISLLLEWNSGVVYRNQVGGHVCYRAEMEGVLVPLDFYADVTSQIESLPYSSMAQGITEEIGVAIDRLLQGNPETQFVSVDFSRLKESWEAWVYVVIDSPPRTDAAIKKHAGYFGPIYGFGSTKGVLTWANSD